MRFHQEKNSRINWKNENPYVSVFFMPGPGPDAGGDFYGPPEPCKLN